MKEQLKKEFEKRVKTLNIDNKAKEELFNKLKIVYENGFQCYYCKERMYLEFENETSFTLDHIIPKAKNGKDELDNLEFVCFQCNSMKADKDAEWYIKNVKRLKERKRKREEQKAIRATVKDKRKREAYKDIFQRLNAKNERKTLP